LTNQFILFIQMLFSQMTRPEISSGRSAADGHFLPLALSETVEFVGTATEAEAILDGIVRRSAEAASSVSSKRRDILWSRQMRFHGIVELRLSSGTRSLFTVAPSDSEADSESRQYRATWQLADPGDGTALLADKIPKIARLMPFTISEADSIRRDMPLTGSVPDLFPGRPLASHSAIFTIHHLSDFLPLIEAALTLGLDPEDVTVIDKEYRYLHGERVDAHLRLSQRLRVRTYSQLEQALEEHFRHSQRSRKRVLVLDDGGYVLPLVLELHPEWLPLIAGVVEQTMSGIHKLAHHQPPMPLFSVAQSHVKATVEAYGVADAAIRNTLSLLPQEKFEGRSALVLGYGRIGSEIAGILRSRRLQVAVFDTDIVRLVSAHERGFVTDRNLSELLSQWRPNLVFGCVGDGSLTAEHFARITWNCYLVSTTSRDREFALTDLARISSSVERMGRIGTRYRLPNGAAVLVLGHGMPINFHYAQSLPNRSIDLVLASVLVGAAVLATKGAELAPGVDLEATNGALEEAGLLSSYYDLWKQGDLAREVALR
jgi:S-adenosylhomocysteine hydrolase